MLRSGYWLLPLIVGCATSDDLRVARQQYRACMELRQERLAMVASGRQVEVPSCVGYQQTQDDIADQLDAQQRLGAAIPNAMGATADSISKNSR